MKKIFALVISVLLVMSMLTVAFAQTQAYTGTDGDGATITVNNPAKGETYQVHKLFDATVSSTSPYKIAYQCTGDIPSGLTSFFSKDSQNYVHPADSIVEKDDDGNITGTKMTDDLKAALEAWATADNVTASAISEGDTLEFTNLPYGYYVMTTTHKTGTGSDAKSAITVTSTKPNASIFDKNVNVPSAKKEVEKESYSIGDTVKYTGTFDTTNYMGSGSDSKQVISYEIKDTLPAYLSDVVVKSITIGGEDYKVNNAVPQFDSNKTITIPWATKDATTGKYTNIYADGAKIVVKYEAKLTSVTNINLKDKNVIGIRPTVDDNGTPTPWEKWWEDDAEIITYAAAILKQDQDGQPLDGATFTFKGLAVAETTGGIYTVVSYDPNGDESTALPTDSNGKLYIVGLAENVELIVTEFKAPDGYNKLTETKTLTPQVLSKQIFKSSGYEKYDSDGNLIEHVETSTTGYEQVTQNLDQLDAGALVITNNKGVELPSTGGIGTTLFYVGGGILVLAAIILLVTKKRMSAND